MANGAQVQLVLNADGSFRWSATSQSGKASTFAGNYTLNGGSLTLVRSNDQQKLSGAVAVSGNQSFTFRPSGANDKGLNFVRV